MTLPPSEMWLRGREPRKGQLSDIAFLRQFAATGHPMLTMRHTSASRNAQQPKRQMLTRIVQA